MLPVVAIVGRPNVGKSTLFNRIVGKRVSITSDIPGTTRDRIYREASWCGVSFRIVDTGGIEILSSISKNDSIKVSVQKEIEFAIEEADIILFVVELSNELTEIEFKIADTLRRSGKKVFLVANKADNEKDFYQNDSYEFIKLGFGNPILVSAIHSIGVADLLDLITDYIRSEFGVISNIEEERKEIRVAILGKPNSGKSTLFNKIAENTKTIVSETPGTTRDPIWGDFFWNGIKLKIWDTAGIRKAKNIDEKIEFYSTRRAFQIIEIVDFVILMVDTSIGPVSRQDVDLIRYSERFGKGILVFLNKWDEVENQKEKFGPDFKKHLTQKLDPEYSWVEVLCGSAKTGKNIKKIFDKVLEIEKKREAVVDKGLLNEVLAEVVSSRFPVKRVTKNPPKVLRIRQKFTKPPCFEVLVKRKELFGEKFEKYLKAKLREKFDFRSVPIYIDMEEEFDFKKKSKLLD